MVVHVFEEYGANTGEQLSAARFIRTARAVCGCVADAIAAVGEVDSCGARLPHAPRVGTKPASWEPDGTAAMCGHYSAFSKQDIRAINAFTAGGLSRLLPADRHAVPKCVTAYIR